MTATAPITHNAERLVAERESAYREGEGMSKGAQVDGQRARASRARSQLPVVAVRSREDMAVMLAVHGGLLREYARHYLPGRGDEAVEESVQRTVLWLLAVPSPSVPHGLRYATKALWRECQRTERRLRAHGVPVDRMLGPVTGDLAVAVDRLGARAREIVMEAARGRTSAEIAAAQNLTPQAVRIRLYHARKRLQQYLAEGRLTVSGLILMSQGRMYGRRERLALAWERWGPPLEWPNGEPLAQAATVALTAVVCSLAFSGTVTFQGLPARGGAQAGQSTPALKSPVSWRPGTSTADPVAHGGPSAAPVSRSLPESGQLSGTRDAVPAGVGRLLAQGDPAAETPEDTQLTAAAAPADFATTHTMLALGAGASCGCPVLFESTDGGTTWTPSPTAAPAGAEQLAVPPTYPADPRIFVGTNPVSGGSTFVIPRFGDMALPLPGPPGHLALATDFGRGDDRVFVAAQGAVMAIEVDKTPATPAPVLLYPQWFGTATVATPPPGDSAATLILAPPGTVVAGTPGAGETQAVELFACGMETSCGVRSVPPPAALNLTTSPSDATTAVSWGTGVVVSGDGGRTFGSSPALQGAVQSVAANAGRVWATSGTGTSVRLFAAPPGGPWTEETGSDPELAHVFRLAAIPGGPVLALLFGRGLRCTADQGATWHDRCP